MGFTENCDDRDRAGRVQNALQPDRAQQRAAERTPAAVPEHHHRRAASAIANFSAAREPGEPSTPTTIDFSVMSVLLGPVSEVSGTGRFRVDDGHGHQPQRPSTPERLVRRRTAFGPLSQPSTPKPTPTPTITSRSMFVPSGSPPGSMSTMRVRQTLRQHRANLSR
jgi:hypothetical protein